MGTKGLAVSTDVDDTVVRPGEVTDVVARSCPICDAPPSEGRCPKHGVPVHDSGLTPTGEALRVGSTVDARYRLVRVLGAGGMGAVYQAVQLGVGREVAVKIMRPEVLSELRLVKRFYREAHALASIAHPNVVRVFDFGVDPRTQSPYLVLELVGGATLEELASAPMPERRARALIAQAVAPLVEMHAKGIVHRDLKPMNIMVERLAEGREHVRLLDLGLAKIFAGDDGLGRLTATGTVLGTPTYMAPEQAAGLGADHRADLYAIGCVLHRLLTGAPPYDAPSALEVMQLHVSASVPALPERLTDGAAPSAELRALHRALLAKAPEDRPAAALDVLRALEDKSAVAIAGHERRRSRLVAPLVIGATVVCAALLIRAGFAPAHPAERTPLTPPGLVPLLEPLPSPSPVVSAPPAAPVPVVPAASPPPPRPRASPSVARPSPSPRPSESATAPLAPAPIPERETREW